MKALIFVLIALSLPGHKALALDPIDICNDAPAMAVLVKDNFPVWTQAPQSQIEPCYQFVVDAANQASLDDLAMLNSEISTQVKVFNNDEDFANYINKDTQVKPIVFETPDDDFTPVVPVVHPKIPRFFTK